MSYQVYIQPNAEEEIEEAYLWIAERAPKTATRWFNKLADEIASLANFPERCAYAPENDVFDQAIRHLLFGRKGRTYRILFTIRDNQVRILHFRHWAKQTMKPEEIQDLDR